MISLPSLFMLFETSDAENGGLPLEKDILAPKSKLSSGPAVMKAQAVFRAA